MSLPPAGRSENGEDGRLLLRQRGLLEPHEARGSLAWSLDLPPGVGALRLRFAFWPDVIDDVRNLLTLGLFDPRGCRGAGHRHAPRQEIVVSPAWATPGFVAGPLPAGRWTVEMNCHCVLPSDAGGVEYDLEVVALAQAPAGPGPGRAAVANGPGVPGSAVAEGAAAGQRWLRGDLHLHSNHSDGRWTVEDLVRHAGTQRFDFIALTDHNTVSGTAALAQAGRRAGLSAVLIPGMELTTYFGHANALGVTEWIDWRVGAPGTAPPALTMAAAAGEVRRRGGTFVVNHPRSMGYPQCTGCRWEFGDESAAHTDLLEVWNGPWGPRPQNVEALALWDTWLNAGWRIPAVAGSDGHVPPRRPELTGLTCVLAEPNPAAILAAVRAGRSYLSSGPSLIWQRPRPGEPLDRDADAVEVEIADLHTAVQAHLIVDGATVERRPVTDDGNLTFDLPAAGGAWCRVELYRRDSGLLLAMTNPAFRA